MTRTGSTKTVDVNGQAIPVDVFEVMMRADRSYRFKYVKSTKKAKTEGARQANLRKIEQLDDSMSFLSYATGVEYKPW